MLELIGDSEEAPIPPLKLTTFKLALLRGKWDKNNRSDGGSFRALNLPSSEPEGGLPLLKEKSLLKKNNEPSPLQRLRALLTGLAG